MADAIDLPTLATLQVQAGAGVSNLPERVGFSAAARYSRLMSAFGRLCWAAFSAGHGSFPESAVTKLPFRIGQLLSLCDATEANAECLLGKRADIPAFTFEQQQSPKPKALRTPRNRPFAAVQLPIFRFQVRPRPLCHSCVAVDQKLDHGGSNIRAGSHVSHFPGQTGLSAVP
ncbi:hypothetical protein [Sphingobium agri]|uniref:Uncharacterized protein n=1 Tax=Sphingobium agri TaxID=2933566 RepID=A0ABT0E0U5_9SPHN|nr:hypothetical protein [Sphingobium agri]MCK0532978.1 hypothetical protein [Sphingobium agri]